MNFLFEWQEQYLTSERSERVKYCSLHDVFTCEDIVSFLSICYHSLYHWLLYNKRYYSLLEPTSIPFITATLTVWLALKYVIVYPYLDKTKKRNRINFKEANKQGRERSNNFLLQLSTIKSNLRCLQFRFFSVIFPPRPLQEETFAQYLVYAVVKVDK